jgi:hypothetical protein
MGSFPPFLINCLSSNSARLGAVGQQMRITSETWIVLYSQSRCFWNSSSIYSIDCYNRTLDDLILRRVCLCGMSEKDGEKHDSLFILKCISPVWNRSNRKCSIATQIHFLYYREMPMIHYAENLRAK